MNITINVAGDLIARHGPDHSGFLPASIEFHGLEGIPQAGHTKVLADGTHLPAGSDRTDHVALIDHTTGLMWLVESIGGADGQSQQDCEKACAALDVLGFKDWRLPTRGELAGLVDDTRTDPAIDVSLFPRVKSRWHWTSTPYAGSASSSAWFVLFDFGYVDYSLRDGDGFALAVRRSGQ